MTGSGGSKRVTKHVNLPESDRAPSRRGNDGVEGHDMRVSTASLSGQVGFKVLKGLLEFQGRLRDMAGVTGGALTFLLYTVTIMLPPLAVAAVCRYIVGLGEVATSVAGGLVFVVFAWAGFVMLIKEVRVRRERAEETLRMAQNRAGQRTLRQPTTAEVTTETPIE